MSLVIATNKDQDGTFRQGQSIYSAYSFRNSLSSVYKIPPHSQVCLQSAKVNLDGRATVSGNNSVWFDWYGAELTNAVPQDESTSYPVVQQFGKGGIVEELTTDELAAKVKSTHREYHPNRMGLFDCQVKRNGGLDFLGFDFSYGFDASQTHASKPKTFEPFDNDGDALLAGDRFTYTVGSGVFQRNHMTDPESPEAFLEGDAAVGIGLGHPLSVSNGSMRVTFSNANASKVTWSVGLSRDCPNPQLDAGPQSYAPPYYEPKINNDNVDFYDFFTDFNCFRNEDGELVLTHFVCLDTGENFMEEVKYWLNTSSDLQDTDRYDIATNTGGYEWVEFRVIGEQVELYIGHAGATDLVTKFVAGESKESYFKPVSQTCWCLHPVLSVGADLVKNAYTNTLTINSFSGMNIAGYDSRTLYKGGWFESMSLLTDTGSQEKGMANCQEVDLRELPNNPYLLEEYTPIGLNASSMVDYKPAMILTPNSTYVETENAAAASALGFIGRSLVNEGAYVGTKLTFSSDGIPSLSSTQSIFVRMNGFGNQVLNARTGNKSTILAHLPTADSRSLGEGSGRFFYEPNRDVWLDLGNSYEIQTSDFSIDFVYSNEQYAKILQGQSIVVLYFRQDPKFA